MSTIACRICLSIESRKVTILHTPLQVIYERITNIPLFSGDGRPVTVCNMCSCYLEKCKNLIEKSVESDKLLRGILQNGVEITKSSICALPKRTVFPNLSVTHFKVLSVGLPSEREVPIKDEVNAENLSSNCPGLLVEHSSLNYQVVNDELITAIKQEEKIDETDIGQIDAEKNVWSKPASTESNPNIKAALLDIPEIAESPFENSQTLKTEQIIDKTLLKGNVCNECGKSFKTKMGLSSHQYRKQHLGPTNTNKCEYCGKIYSEKSRLNYHIRLEHTKKDLTNCHYCSKKFVRKSLLNKHMASHHLDELNGQYNDNAGTTLIKLNNEIETTQTGNMFNCRYCRESFYQYVQLRTHLKEHTNITFDCDHCGKSYKRRNTLVYHMRSHANRTRLYHNCNLCSKQFTAKKGLNVHMRRHSEKKAFICEYCDASFHYKASLQRHTLVHTGIKPYQCDYCGKSYKDRNCLIDHINFKHSVMGTEIKKMIKKKYNCTLCPKSFISSTDLTIHTRRHTGEKPFQCTHCDKGCVSKMALKMHLQKHSGIKHECKHCDKSFNQIENLRIHEKTHTSENPYMCVYCNEILSWPWSLKKHILRKHSKEVK